MAPRGSVVLTDYLNYLELSQGDKLSEDFLAARRDLLSQGIEERKLFIELRKSAYERNIDEILSTVREKEHRLEFLSPDEKSERVALMNHVLKLGSEVRSERVRVVTDVARMSNDLFTRLQEYEEIKQLTGRKPEPERLFRPVVVDRGDELEWL